MATYISLVKYTQQGISRIKESPSRLDDAKKSYESMGAEIKQFYLVTGQYDIVVIFEAEDNATAAKVALATGSLGNVKTETLLAFTEDEYQKIIGELP
jgi:uncharacterized protein with GYD domain